MALLSTRLQLGTLKTIPGQVKVRWGGQQPPQTSERQEEAAAREDRGGTEKENSCYES